MYTRFAVDPHIASIPSTSIAPAPFKIKPIASGVNVIVLPSKAPPPVQQAGHHRTRLDLIRNDLQAYTHGTNERIGEEGHYDDLATGPSAEQRQIMINSLTEGLGYDVDSAICALQLVEYRSVAEAANILMQITVTLTGTLERSTLSSGSAASPPLQIYSYEYGGNVAETDADLEASSLTTLDDVQSGAGSAQSIAAPSTHTIHHNEEGGFSERPHSTGTSYLYHNAPRLLPHSPQEGMTSDGAVRVAVPLSPGGRWNCTAAGENVNAVHNIQRSNSLGEPPPPYAEVVKGNNVSRIQINGTSRMTSVSSAVNGSRVIKLGRVSSERIQLPRETGHASIAPTSHYPLRLWQAEKAVAVHNQYNPTSLQFGSNSQQTGVATPTVLRIGEGGEFLRRPNERGLITTFGISPNTTPTTDVSATYPKRSVSPLPSQPDSSRLQSGEVGGPYTRVKSCKSPMYRFFVEQHIEKLSEHSPLCLLFTGPTGRASVQQHKERLHREAQLTKEMEAYGAMYGFTENDKQQMLAVLRQKESKYIRLKRQKLDKGMFDIIRQIGVGAFGMVMLAKKKDTEQTYAMKVLSKEDVIKKQQLAHVKAERDILAEANSNWVVKLFFSFQDTQNLYFIMEFVHGGDLMSLLITKGIFSERLARFYVAELTCALEYVHSLGFIHRDIKPDNILIDKNGHIKLTDFGLCTGLRWTHDKRHYVTYDDDGDGQALHYRDDSFTLPQNIIVAGSRPKGGPEYRHQKKRNEAHSVVGTGNYMAPEVITKIGHTQMCDWWSVGVICYEMVYGRPPFLSLNECADETQYMVVMLGAPRSATFTTDHTVLIKIVNWRNYLDLNNPMGARLSCACKEFITRLCCDQDARLGCKEGAREIKHHQWFKGIDFANLRNTRAEYIPKVKHEEDTSNFDACEVDSKELFKEVRGKRGSKGYNPAFYDFTFRHFFSFDGDRPPVPAASPSRHLHRPGLAPLVEMNSHRESES